MSGFCHALAAILVLLIGVRVIADRYDSRDGGDDDDQSFA